MLVVAGGAALTRERVRPRRLPGARRRRSRSTCAALFAVRDNVVRWVARDAHPPAARRGRRVAARRAALLALYLLVVSAATSAGKLRAAAAPFAPAGVALGVGYICLLEAFSHGRVSDRRAAERDAVALGGRVRGARCSGGAEAIGSRLVARGRARSSPAAR